MFRMEMEEGSLVSCKSESICHGMMVWKEGRKGCWVVRYPISIALSASVFLALVAHHYINFGHTSWFNKYLEYNYPFSGVMNAYIIFRHREKIRRVSRHLDICCLWNYAHLEKEREELKRKAVDKINRFNYFYYKFMVIGGICYSLLPFSRYCYNTDDSSNLLSFQCWSPFPQSTWWGFSITYLLELITIVSVFLLFGSIITFLITTVITIGNQLQLISIALNTTVQRAAMAMKETALPEEQEDRDSLRTWIIQNELNNSVNHLQKIFRITEDVCQFFTIPVSICYYPSIFAIALCCCKLSMERENKFLLFQITFIVVAILLNQYLVAFINQILTDQMENLRLAVYDTRWYTMHVSCRKTIHIMQSMVLKKPAIKTIMGARVDMEFFAMVCNASYYYLSALLSMKITY